MFENMILISLITSLIIILLILSYKVFNIEYSAKYRYIIWILIAVRLLIPFQIEIPNNMIKIDLPIQTITSYQDANLNQRGSNATQEDVIKNNTNIDNLEITLNESIKLIWAFGAAVFLIIHIVAYKKFKKTVNIWSKPLDIACELPVYTCKKIDTPMLIGIFNPKILIPNQAYSETELEAVLDHEMVHFKRKDLWIKAMFIVVNAIHWFNPIVYIMVNSANWDMELSCDDRVVFNKSIDFKKTYSSIILRVANSNKINLLTTQLSGGKINMKKRLENIFDKNTKKSGTLLVAIIVVSLMSSALVGCSTSKNSETEVEIEGMPSTIKGILSETEKNAELEKLIKDTFQIPEENLADTKYYYNNVDLNSDGKDEIIAVAIGSYTSGTGGDSALIVSKEGDKLEVMQELSLVHEPIIVSENVTNGYKDIIVPNYGGGADPKEAYKVLKNKDGYYSNMNSSEAVSEISDVKGIAIIANDIAKDIEAGKALSLR